MVEVLIAGAGPAGATAAILLARSGIRVLLVDRARFPRDKLCGDTLNPGALRVIDRLGLRAEVESRGLPLHGMLVTGESGIQIHGQYTPPFAGRSIIRRDLDMLLVQAAVTAGAHFQDQVRIVDPIIDTDTGRGPIVRGAVLATRDGKRLRVPAALTIAADGRRSTLAFALGLARQPRHPRRWVAGAYFEGVEEMTSDLGEMHVRPHHYMGVAPVPGGVANVCYVSEAREGFRNPATLLSSRLAADPLLRDRFAHARLASPVTLLGPLAVDVPVAGAPGLLLAGDAAGFIDPITGDGLRFALRGGELAADTARHFLDTPEHPWHETLTYRRAQEFAHKHRFNRIVRSLVATPSAVRLATHAAAIGPGLLRQLIAYAADLHTT